jgi:hypothetical protein
MQPTPIATTAEPAGKNNRKTGNADHRRDEHILSWPHRNKGNRNARQRTEERSPRGNLPDDRRDKPAGHQYEALNEHPGQTCFPALDRVTRFGGDRQHDYERDHKHMRHAGPGRKCANVVTTRTLGQTVGQPCIVERTEEEHHPGGRKYSSENE